MNTATTTPRFRTDLVTQPIDAEGQRFVDVTNPDSGTTFRFYEVEYAIACAMDGRRDVGRLADWALEELGLETSSNELETVISTLSSLGYLEAVAVPTGAVELGSPGGAAPAVAAADYGAGDVELGAPGKSPIARDRLQPAPAAPVELGAPGGSAGGDTEQSFDGLLDDEPPTRVRPVPPRPSDDEATAVRAAKPDPDDFLDGLTPPPAEVPSARLRPVTREPAADDDGPTNLPPPAPGLDEPEVSVDRSEHLSIDASDVKEAVRQSQVMQAVNVPADLLAELEAEKAAPVAAPPVAAAPAAAPPSPRPIELPQEPAQVTAARPASAVEAPATEPPPAPRKSGVSGLLLFLLFVVLAGGGAYYYFMVYKKGQEADGPNGATANSGAQGTAAKPPTPPPPKPITGVLQEKKSEAAVIATTASGAVTISVKDGDEVAAGDVVATISGGDRIEKKIQSVSDRRDQYQGKLDRAQARLEGATGAIKTALEKDIARYQGKVTSKTETIAELQQELTQFQLTAPRDGVVKVVGESKWLKEGSPVVEIAGESLFMTSFELRAGMQLVEGAVAKISLQEAPTAAVSCDVVAVEGRVVTVICPAVEPLAVGKTVVLKQ